MLMWQGINQPAIHTTIYSQDGKVANILCKLDHAAALKILCIFFFVKLNIKFRLIHVKIIIVSPRIIFPISFFIQMMKKGKRAKFKHWSRRMASFCNQQDKTFQNGIQYLASYNREIGFFFFNIQF